MTTSPSKTPKVTADNPVAQAALRALAPVCRYFDVRLEGLEHLPDHGALLVGNHAYMGIDSLALFPELYRQTDRMPRGMALRALFDVPGVARVLRDLGAVAGGREPAIELLERNELVVTYPGGMHDSFKTRQDRYTLKWGRRAGFAHVAIRAGSPVVPVAAIGPDDAFLLPARALIPAALLGDRRTRVPFTIPLPRPVPFVFYFGRPIAPPAVADDADPVVRLRAGRAFAAQIRRALEALIDHGLAERAETAPTGGLRRWLRGPGT